MTQANLGLLVRLKAKSSKESEVEAFLQNAVALAKAEKGTTTWFALKLEKNVFGIFDTFADAEGRNAHRNGEIASQLRQVAGDLLSEPPTIEPVDVLGYKL